MNKLRNFLEIRENARRLGDVRLQRAMDYEMQKLGYVAPETTQAPVMEMAIPEKPRRGRPPKPRCEHGNLVDRCVECGEDPTGTFVGEVGA